MNFRSSCHELQCIIADHSALFYYLKKLRPYLAQWSSAMCLTVTSSPPSATSLFLRARMDSHARTAHMPSFSLRMSATSVRSDASRQLPPFQGRPISPKAPQLEMNRLLLLKWASWVLTDKAPAHVLHQHLDSLLGKLQCLLSWCLRLTVCDRCQCQRTPHRRYCTARHPLRSANHKEFSTQNYGQTGHKTQRYTQSQSAR